jgi:hypothetical protein
MLHVAWQKLSFLIERSFTPPLKRLRTMHISEIIKDMIEQVGGIMGGLTGGLGSGRGGASGANNMAPNDTIYLCNFRHIV